MKGFTMVELIMVIVIIGILASTAAMRWPTGMREEAAFQEFKRSVRQAQHQAMTRRFDETTPGKAWGIVVNANQYTIRRADNSETAEAEYVNRTLPGNAAISNGAVYFNGLGVPLDAAGNQLAAALVFTVSGDGDGSGTSLTVCPQTGYAQRGSSCP